MKHSVFKQTFFQFWINTPHKQFEIRWIVTNHLHATMQYLFTRILQPKKNLKTKKLWLLSDTISYLQKCNFVFSLKFYIRFIIFNQSYFVSRQTKNYEFQSFSLFACHECLLLMIDNLIFHIYTFPAIHFLSNTFICISIGIHHTKKALYLILFIFVLRYISTSKNI